MKIRLAGLLHESLVDGPGFRSVVFVQGCPHHCFGCHSPQTQPLSGGKLIETDRIVKDLLSRPLLDGITFSGGEPFVQSAALVELIEKVFSRKKVDLWIYSGYLLDQLIKMGEKKKDVKKLLGLASVLVDGPFVLSQRDLSLAFRGSSNQRLIDLAQTFTQKKIVLWKRA